MNSTVTTNSATVTVVESESEKALSLFNKGPGKKLGKDPGDGSSGAVTNDEVLSALSTVTVKLKDLQSKKMF